MECYLVQNGGSSLNFKVVGSTAQPASPKENLIWVNTSTKISSWAFGTEEPAVKSAGTVWIVTGVSSSNAFNALKKNALMIYPTVAKQYNGSTWADVAAKIYKGGQWHDFVDWDVLFDYGDNIVVTGGWNNVANNLNSETNGIKKLTVTINDDGSWTLTNDSLYNGTLHTVNKIDLTNYNKLCFDGYIHDRGTYHTLSIWTEIGNSVDSNRAAYVGTTTDDHAEINISALSGSYYIGFNVYHNSGNTTIRKLWLE